MANDRQRESLYRALGYGDVRDDPGGMYAGFVPDFSMTPLRSLKKEEDEVFALSATATRRVVEFAGPKRVAMRVYIYVGARSGAAARFALASELADFSRPLNSESGERLGLNIGQFTTVEAGTRVSKLLAFGRENVAILLLEQRGETSAVVAAARALDAQLHCSPVYDEEGVAALSPRVDAFYVNATRIDANSSVPLILTSRCPMGLDLTYRFETTHGAVDRVSKEPPRFAYQTGNASGPQSVVAFVASRAGLVTARGIEFSIATGDLGHRPGR